MKPDLKVILSVEAVEPNLSGIGRYSLELARRMDMVEGVRDVRFYRNGRWITEPEKLLRSPLIGSQWQRWLRRRMPLIRDMEQRKTQRLGKSHLFHGPNFFLPEIGEGGVITVHDLSVLRYPEMHPEERLHYFDKEFSKSLGRAGHVITDSETTRLEVIETLSLKATDVTAVPLGVDSAFHPRSGGLLHKALERYDLRPDEYALCVSTVEPRKRLAELLVAWEMLPSRIRGRWPLIVTGGAGWLSEKVHRLMDKGQREGWVRYLGYIPEADLPIFYAGARLFVYPSIYEGFGLPPIEAMASGTPTIVADASCLPEVTAGGAMLTRPEDPSIFALNLERALTDEQWRVAARTRGLAVAAGYSWQRCVESTVSVYRKLR